MNKPHLRSTYLYSKGFIEFKQPNYREAEIAVAEKTTREYEDAPVPGVAAALPVNFAVKQGPLYSHFTEKIKAESSKAGHRNLLLYPLAPWWIKGHLAGTRAADLSFTEVEATSSPLHSPPAKPERIFGGYKGDLHIIYIIIDY